MHRVREEKLTEWLRRKLGRKRARDKEEREWLEKERAEQEVVVIIFEAEDIHNVGIVFLKMLLNLDVDDRFIRVSCSLFDVSLPNLNATPSVNFTSLGPTSSDRDSSDQKTDGF